MTDYRVAYLAMAASNSAYELDAGRRAALLAAAGLSEISYLQGPNDARALVATGAGETFLAFQGTQASALELPSIAANLEVEPVDLGGGEAGQVDAGYWRQLLDLMPQLAALALDGPLIATGHSMGGSMAHLFGGVFLVAPGSRVITFGAPKCANAEFWSWVSLRPERWVHERDFAPDYPYLPVEWVQPAGIYLWLRNGAAREMTGGRDGVNVSVADHMPARYLEAMTAIF